MGNSLSTKRHFPFITVLIWGGLWGIFETTVGFALHLLPIRIGWLVWYPVACFFMMSVYLLTNRISAVIAVGFLAGGLKLVNLLSPIPIDRVINPAVSIVLEACALGAVLFVANRYFANNGPTLLHSGMMVILMNTGWRLLYMCYLAILVPDWMREISVISNYTAITKFFLLENLATCAVLFLGAIIKTHWETGIAHISNRFDNSFQMIFTNKSGFAKHVVAVGLVLSSVMIDYIV